MTRLSLPTRNNSTQTKLASAAPSEPMSEPTPPLIPEPMADPVSDPTPHPMSDPIPDPVIIQAKRDLDAGMVDTDMRAMPGLDAQRRSRLVSGLTRKIRTSGG